MIPKKILLYFPSSDHTLKDKIRMKIKEKAEILLKIVNETNGTFITPKARVNLSNMLEETDGNLYMGGSQTLFVWQFKISKINNVVLKPYTASFIELVYHYLSIRKFNESFKDTFFFTNIGKVKLRAMEVYALGIIEFSTKSVPFMVQNYSQGIPLHKPPLTNNLALEPLRLCQFFKIVAASKFTIDPSPVNWRINPELDSSYTLDYLDLIFYHDLSLKKEAKDWINVMKNSENETTFNYGD